MNDNQKTHYKFHELSGMTGVRPYVLRFWESEFHEIAPVLSDGEKLYSKKDLVLVSEIKRLLFDEKMTIEQAKHYLRKGEKVKVQKTKVALSKEVTADTNIEKAKEKLNEMISHIDHIRELHNWH